VYTRIRSGIVAKTKVGISECGGGVCFSRELDPDELYRPAGKIQTRANDSDYTSVSVRER
jgi:hypothetical protein